MKVIRGLLSVAVVAGASLCASGDVRAANGPAGKNSAIDQINTVVVIYAENRSFDNLLRPFPGRQRLAERHSRAFHAGRPRRHRSRESCRRSGTASRPRA